MSIKRSFHSAAQSLVRFLGYPAEKLEAPFGGAFFTYLDNGAIKVSLSPMKFILKKFGLIVSKKVGEIESAEIL